MSDKELQREMLLRELAGIDLELKVARESHVTNTQAVYDLERERSNLVDELDRISPYE